MFSKRRVNSPQKHVVASGQKSHQKRLAEAFLLSITMHLWRKKKLFIRSSLSEAVDELIEQTVKEYNVLIKKGITNNLFWYIVCKISTYYSVVISLSLKR